VRVSRFTRYLLVARIDEQVCRSSVLCRLGDSHLLLAIFNIILDLFNHLLRHQLALKQLDLLLLLSDLSDELLLIGIRCLALVASTPDVDVDGAVGTC
jgi:hypothetical protein